MPGFLSPGSNQAGEPCVRSTKARPNPRHHRRTMSQGETNTTPFGLAQPLKNPLRCVLLLPRPTFVLKILKGTSKNRDLREFVRI
jgi:hypothetical protein